MAAVCSLSSCKVTQRQSETLLCKTADIFKVITWICLISNEEVINYYANVDASWNAKLFGLIATDLVQLYVL